MGHSVEKMFVTQSSFFNLNSLMNTKQPKKQERPEFAPGRKTREMPSKYPVIIMFLHTALRVEEKEEHQKEMGLRLKLSHLITLIIMEVILDLEEYLVAHK